MSNGLRLEGEKYQFLREEDGKIVYAKKKGMGAITSQASKTAIVIGHCPEGSQQGNLNKAVGVIADYLESMNMWLQPIVLVLWNCLVLAINKQIFFLFCDTKLVNHNLAGINFMFWFY